MRRILLLLSMTLLFATRLTAQQASLIGTVLDESPEKPITDAEVSIEVLKLVARTDAAGSPMISWKNTKDGSSPRYSAEGSQGFAAIPSGARSGRWPVRAE